MNSPNLGDMIIDENKIVLQSISSHQVCLELIEVDVEGAVEPVQLVVNRFFWEWKLQWTSLLMMRGKTDDDQHLVDLRDAVIEEMIWAISLLRLV